MTQNRVLPLIRLCLGSFIIGLALSGLTAFPLLQELELLCSLLTIDTPPTAENSGMAWWLSYVRDGLQYTHRHYPFLAYGTDWLAFGHLVIALFFIGPFVNPVRNIWVIYAGLIACVSVIPLALICGPIRGIPPYWRAIDCSFGVIGFIPLWIALKLTKRLSPSIGI